MSNLNVRQNLESIMQEFQILNENDLFGGRKIASFTLAHFSTHFSASIRHILFACVNALHICCVDPTHFICVCKCTAHFPRRAFTLTHFPSGKSGMSAFGTYVATRKMRQKVSIYW